MADPLNPKSDRKFTTVSIPTPLFKKVEARIQNTGFTSVSSYVTYVLREIVVKDDDASKASFTEDDEKRVKARLRALGYLD